MTKKQSKALHNLKMAIYTPMLFGVMFIATIPLARWLDPEGSLVDRINSSPLFNPPTMLAGGMLLFFGINAYIYFNRFVQTLSQSERSESDSKLVHGG